MLLMMLWLSSNTKCSLFLMTNSTQYCMNQIRLHKLDRLLKYLVPKLAQNGFRKFPSFLSKEAHFFQSHADKIKNNMKQKVTVKKLLNFGVKKTWPKRIIRFLATLFTIQRQNNTCFYSLPILT